MQLPKRMRRAAIRWQRQLEALAPAQAHAQAHAQARLLARADLQATARAVARPWSMATGTLVGAIIFGGTSLGHHDWIDAVTHPPSIAFSIGLGVLAAHAMQRRLVADLLAGAALLCPDMSD